MLSNPFGKDLSQIEFADIQKLKDTGRTESQILEYKERMPTKIDLQKEVLGFANNIGGYLIIGVREKKPEGTPELIVGINKERNVKESIVNIVRDNSSPSFVPSVQLVDLPTDSTKCVIIVYSHESDTVHRASDGRYYYRTENETIPVSPEFVAKIIGKHNIISKLNKIVEELDWRRMPEKMGINIGNSCWLSVICCPIPPESFRMSVFTEIDWYYKAAVSSIASVGSFDKKSTADSLRVFKVRVNGSPNAMIEYYENGIILYCCILYGGNKSIVEGRLRDILSRFLDLTVKTYGKALFDGGLWLLFGLGNIAGWKWTIGKFLEHLSYEILPSNTPYLQVTHETTVSALQSSIDSTVEPIIAKFRRHFNIH